MSGFTREVEFQPAFDRRDPDPKKNYGIHGATLRFLLRGERGATQLVVYTNWHLPHVQDELDAEKPGKFPHLICHPLPADLGYHSPKPMYDGQTPMGRDCDVIGGTCYYGGSGMEAERVYKRLVRDGDVAVWQELEDYYRETFGDQEKVPA